MAQRRRQRRRWSDDKKRTIVAATHEPGTLVSRVARRYDVNASQVFNWARDPRFAPAENGEARAGPVFCPIQIVGETVATPKDTILGADPYRGHLFVCCGRSGDGTRGATLISTTEVDDAEAGLFGFLVGQRCFLIEARVHDANGAPLYFQRILAPCEDFAPSF